MKMTNQRLKIPPKLKGLRLNNKDVITVLEEQQEYFIIKKKPNHFKHNMLSVQDVISGYPSMHIEE